MRTRLFELNGRIYKVPALWDKQFPLKGLSWLVYQLTAVDWNDGFKVKTLLEVQKEKKDEKI